MDIESHTNTLTFINYIFIFIFVLFTFIFYVNVKYRNRYEIIKKAVKRRFFVKTPFVSLVLNIIYNNSMINLNYNPNKIIVIFDVIPKETIRKLEVYNKIVTVYNILLNLLRNNIKSDTKKSVTERREYYNDLLGQMYKKHLKVSNFNKNDVLYSLVTEVDYGNETALKWLLILFSTDILSEDKIPSHIMLNTFHDVETTVFDENFILNL